jgi:putative SOS response-associated peptidase YedK
MCNRICLSTDIDTIRSHFGILGDKSQFQPHWNIGAGHVLPVIRRDPFLQRRRLERMRWGLIPAFAKTSVIVRANIDVRSIEDESSNSAPHPSRRCLIPVDNFYEWRLHDKQPFAVALASRQVMALAGVWDHWMSPSGEGIKCFAIVTTAANNLLAPLCEHMPAIIPPEDWDLWLSGEAWKGSRVSSLLRPCTDTLLTIWPIDRRVSNAKNDNPKILEPVTDC